MSTPLLSIVIPTYNREAMMQLLLADIDMVLQSFRNQVQIVICNNASTDATNALIERYRPFWGEALKVISRKTNIGMEGNIACAMAEGDGEYVWMLSDHQRLCVPAVNRAIEFMGTHAFDIGHAKLIQWSPALSERDKIFSWDDLSPHQRGALFFSLTNLSTLIFRRTFGESAMKSVFRSCVWGFPHLGIISRIDGDTRLVEFDSMSMLPDTRDGVQLVHDYNKIAVRFHCSVVCVKTLSQGAGINFALSGFFTPDYHTAFLGEILNFLVQPTVTRHEALRTLGPVIAVNPVRLKAVGLFVLLVILLVPENIRIKVASLAKGWIARQRRQRGARR
jgi:glycosyltransferase involved in cell wall biosynthesis